MAIIVEVTAVGGGVGIVLPREMMEKPRVKKRDTLYLTHNSTALQISPRAPDFEDKIAAGFHDR